MNVLSTIGGRRTSIAGILSLAFLYVLLIVLMLYYSLVVLQTVSLPGNSPSVIAAMIIIVIPLSMIVILAVYIAGVIRDKRKNRPGIRLKTRLLSFFLLISILSGIPQALLSVTFSDTMMKSWYRSRIGEALDGGLSIALEYYQEKLAKLENFAEDQLVSYQKSYGASDRLWRQIRRQYPEIVSLQILDAKGAETFFAGETGGKATQSELRGIRDSFLPKLSVTDGSYLRYAKSTDSNGARTIVTAIKIPAEFDRKAEALTQSLAMYNQVDKNRRAFGYVILGFYIAFSLPMALFAVLIAFMLSESFVQPLVDLEEATRRVSEGDFSFRILTRSDDELSALSVSFNRMISELEVSRSKILQDEKITVWQDIARRLAHEIRNPLTPIKLNAERVLRKMKTNPEELLPILEPAMQSIVREVDGLNTLLEEFRDFAKLPGPQFEWCNLRNVVLETAQVYGSSFPDVTFDCSRVDGAVNLMADRGHLKQVFSNLFKNAIDAMNGKGSVAIRTDLVKRTNSLYCRIQVQDTGGGIPEEIRDRIFAPYFTTKTFGTGLGLSIVEHIVIDHRGQIWFETEKGSGTTFFIDLPVEQQPELEEL
jgi:two-component system, NtrC family, nitrogen regulation sensor histidine kinase NtrY